MFNPFKFFYELRWKKAQKAEHDSWKYLWEGERSKNCQKLITAEIKKHTFLIDNLKEIFSLNFSELKNSVILDVACGPVSYFSRLNLTEVEGIDPLEYPDWVYKNYLSRNFIVHKTCFEEFRGCDHNYDYIFFYNALQHFMDLSKVSGQCDRLLKDTGKIYIADYLEIPTDPAHPQFLTKANLDLLFKNFNVRSFSKKLRLPGYVEIASGLPASIYFAEITRRGN